MRLLTSHIVNPANDRLKIEVLDEPGQGNACHVYKITGFDLRTNPGQSRLQDRTRERMARQVEGTHAL